MCNCATLTRERLANARADGVAVEHLGDVLYVVASTSKLNTTYDVEAIGDDWHEWTCECTAPRYAGCIHKRAAWRELQQITRKAKRATVPRLMLAIGTRAAE